MARVEASAVDSPYMKGRMARTLGHARESCPYEEGTEAYQGWHEGFNNEMPDEDLSVER
jgi:ribosome modulation factor